MYAVEARGIRKSFGRLNVLHGISFRLGIGETMVLLGPNGAGKSTLLKICANLYKPSAGSVKVFGSAMSTGSDAARGKLSFLGENYALYDNLTAMRNLEFFGRLYDIGDAEIRRRATRWLRKFGALKYRDRKVGELSRGTKQKVALCRALLNEPQLLLLDEPSAFLDPAASNMLHRELADISKSGTSIIYATQRLDELYKIGDKVFLIRNGRKVAMGAANSIVGRLHNIETEVLLSRPLLGPRFAALSRKWKIRHGDSDRSLVFHLGSVGQIPDAVRDVVVIGKGDIVSVLYLKESIERILQGR
ncbi:MAG: ABC transporter ATP-binding protein [Candidatus Micrarchaeaceae archaeon]